MAKSHPAQGRFGTRLYAWVIIFTGMAVFLAVFWLRTRTAGPTALEQLIAANEPEEHVHALAAAPNGTAYVATHFGVIAGTAETAWTRMAGIQADVTGLAVIAEDMLYLSGPTIGVSRYRAGQLQQLYQGGVEALAVDPSDARYIVATRFEGGLLRSADGGGTWSDLTAPGGTGITAVAIDPRDHRRLLAGGLNGFLALSNDGGQSWTTPAPIQGTVTALAFEPTPPYRLWAAAGGALSVSDGPEAPWRRLPDQSGGRTVVALAFPAGVGTEPLAITAEGYLFNQR